MDDGDILCHPILVLPFLQDFDVANARVGAERNPLKTEVIFYVNDLDAAPPEWRIGDVRSMAKTFAVTDGSITLGVAVGSRQFIADELVSNADVIRAMHKRVQLCQDPQTEFSLLRGCLGVSRINQILRFHGHTILEEQSAAAVFDEIGQRSLEQLFPGLAEDSMTQKKNSDGQSEIGFKRARDIAAARFFIRRAPQAADESWQHTVSGQQGPGVAGPTIASLGHPGFASQDDDSDDMDFSAHPRKADQLQAQLVTIIARWTQGSAATDALVIRHA